MKSLWLSSDAVANRTISVNFRNNNRLRPRTGRFGLQPNRILRGNFEDFKKPLESRLGSQDR